MGKIDCIYSSINGKQILTSESEKEYESVLNGFLTTNDKYMLYDDLSGKIMLLNESEMKNHYISGNYRNYTDREYSFDDFCLSCCIEVLKNFSDYSVEDIKEELKKHNILKMYC